jgi:hydroxyacylglutathione hydrolase
MQFIFEQVRTGGDRNFGYLIGDRKAGTGVLIDPSYAPELLLERATAQGLRVTHILNTHGHSDHTNGNAVAAKRTGAPVAGGPGSDADLILKDGDVLAVGAFRIRAWHVPGHCPDHLAFLVEDLCVGLTGDHLFVGKIGGTHADPDAKVEWESLHRLLKDWPSQTTIWPGHDYGARPSSTLALERITNPFLMCADLGAFLQLKREWPEFKVRHGLK